MSQCKIYLENYNGTYYAGTEIRGRLECYFDDETSFRGIKIRLKCKEHNEWMGTEEYDDHDHTRKTRTITFTGDHNVLYLEQMLVGSGSGSHVLNRGRHVFPFQFFLPTDIPSSFTGPHGSITYKLKSIVDRPMKFDFEDEFIFVVVSPIDFNQMPKELQNPTSYSDEKTVCCWCCRGGNVTMDVELPKTTFVPGEMFTLKVRVSNLSNSNVEDLKVKFTKTIKYKVTEPQSESKEDEEEIYSHKDHGVGAHGEHTFIMQMQIPQHIVVPNFTRCELFEVKYVMNVTCEMPCCTLNLDVDIRDVQLGHVQWRGGQTEGGATAFGFNSHSNLPPIDDFYPPPLPPNAASVYPPGPMGFGGQPPVPPMYGGDQQNYPQPPGSYNPGFTKAQEAGQPSAPMAPPTEPPPPSYNAVQQSSNNYYPPR